MTKATLRQTKVQKRAVSRPAKIDLRMRGPNSPKFDASLGIQRLQDQAIQKFQRAVEEAAKAAFAEVADRYALGMPGRITLLTSLLRQHEKEARSHPDMPPLPTQAPELWSDRVGRKENPIDFIKRVYEDWLGKGLTRAQLGNLDLPLYRALSVWVHRHPDDEMPELPSLSQIIDEKIARLSDEFTPDELRKLGLAIQNRLRRKTI